MEGGGGLYFTTPSTLRDTCTYQFLDESLSGGGGGQHQQRGQASFFLHGGLVSFKQLVNGVPGGGYGHSEGRTQHPRRHPV